MWFHENIHSGIKIKNLIVNFMPSWWYKNYGFAYGKEMLFDPDYRMEAHREMRRAFYQRFGKQLGEGEENPVRTLIAPDWDNTYYQAMMGFDVQTPKDQYPMAHGTLTQQQIDTLTVPGDILSVYPFNEVSKQIQYMNRTLGTDEPVQLRTRGILNEAVQMMGTDFYGDLLDEDYDEQNTRIMGFVRGVIQNQLLENKSRSPAASHIMMNCTAGIAGAPAYDAYVYAQDKALYDFCRQNGIPVGIHHCGKFDDFVSIYARMPAVNFLEIGHESQIRPVLEKYPHAHVQYIVSTELVSYGKASDVRDTVLAALDEAKGFEDRFTLSVADLEYGMPDDNLFELVAALKK